MPIKLLLRNMLGHPIRSVLTIASVAVAVFLICMLHAVVAGLQRTVDAAASNRLMVQSAVSLFVDLPLGYQQKLSAIDGVEAICKWQWFGGRNEKEKGGRFPQFGIDPEVFLPSYPEIEVDEGSYDDFLNNRASCFVGKDLLDQFDWKIGQTVPITGTIYTRTDGKPWEFTIAASYRSNADNFDQQQFYFHYDYLRESLEGGSAVGPDGVGVYMLRVAPDGDALTIQAAVDSMFENGPQRTQTSPEAEFNRQFITMLGDVPLLLQMIGGAVLFAIFFAVLNTMIMAGRERTRDLGILKALGFSNGTTASLLLFESLALCSFGAIFGVAASVGLERPFQRALAQNVPGFGFDSSTLLFGTLLALLVGLLSGVVPGIRAARISTVQALREID